MSEVVAEVEGPGWTEVVKVPRGSAETLSSVLGTAKEQINAAITKHMEGDTTQEDVSKDYLDADDDDDDDDEAAEGAPHQDKAATTQSSKKPKTDA
ncbi:hypothetical protein PTSG_06109 [Salpingoeca rosetta]|uniref:Uncharacterized protein n=1 Tax=Salpingoeca rosetta (strain ATCC 50818 / BSB-021) TaxID=946362 RepID=F2UDQ1_SALR5|nr:uncharacterized protein PTSG_06109 [Salpingoeca rosetta]EGD74746.1 hypothetical protein PTSG_06109 [Salpingoeca rosetta]|eukprot:XP_004993003.1 hypothetical protein PTSG_06109 [Salpingoeca rosetta]